MPEQDTHGYHRRLRGLGDRARVVDRLGSSIFSNKDNPQGSLCSIEHDLLTDSLPWWWRSRAGHLPSPPYRWRHLPSTHTISLPNPQVWSGDQPLGRPRQPASAPLALQEHHLLPPGTAANRATGSFGVTDTHRVIGPTQCVTNAYGDSIFRVPLKLRWTIPTTHADAHRYTARSDEAPLDSHPTARLCRSSIPFIRTVGWPRSPGPSRTLSRPRGLLGP